jgi:endoglucanase
MNPTLLILLASLVMLMLAAPLGAQVPKARLERLGRGVNISHWYAQSMRGYGEDHLGSYFTEKDAQLIAQMGFKHVRFTLDDRVLMDRDRPDELNAENLRRFDQRLAWFKKHGLLAIVDLHPGDEYKKWITTPAGADGFVRHWRALAKDLSTTDPDWVMLEVMNEPHVVKDQAWQELQGRVIQAMRQAAPDHTIIATGGEWGSLDQLLKLRPYDDTNIVYTFHWYLPFMFTHQAAEWGWSATRPVGGLAWPLEPEQAEEVSQAVTQDPESRKQVRWAISQGTFRREWMRQQLDQVVQWQAQNGNVPVYVGEFGVYQKASPRDARLAWYRASREEFEQRGWGWSIWDYAGGFAVVQGSAGARQPDDQMVQALGLGE